MEPDIAPPDEAAAKPPHVSVSMESNVAHREAATHDAPPKASWASPLHHFITKHFNIAQGKQLIHYQMTLLIVALVASFIFTLHFALKSESEFITANTDRQGFTGGPKERGTTNIIWSCITTIFTCSYALLHLDVPAHDSIGDREMFLIASFVRRRIPRILFNIVAPEICAYIAIVEYFCARERGKVMKESWGRICKDPKHRDLKPGQIGDWTLKHQFFADMGGFEILVTPSTSPPLDAHSDRKPIKSGEDFLKWMMNNPDAFSRINLKQLGRDIEDKGKGGFAKTVAIVQAFGLVIRCIVRAIEHRAAAPLEITTCSYVASAVFTYAFLLRKPYGVEGHVLLSVHQERPPTWIQEEDPTPFNRKTSASTLDSVAIIISGCVGACIGAIHCLLWNTSSFPGTDSRMVWRVCCIMQIASSLCTSVLLAIPGARAKALFRWKEEYDSWCIALAFIPCFFQFWARIMILILAGYSFRSLPASVYLETQWLAWLPHFD